MESKPKPNSGGRILELDGLRGVAVIAILLAHYFYLGAKGPARHWMSFARPLAFGWSGVDLFFVLSGFLIGGILLDNRESPEYFNTFYWRRIWRIIPLYAVLCISFWALYFILGFCGIIRPYWLFHDPMPWYSCATMTQNIWVARSATFGAGWLGVTWSLAVEEQFYFCAPAIIRWNRPSRLPLFLLFTIVAGWCIRQLCSSLLVTYFPNPGLTAYVLTPCHLDGLAVGMLIAWAVRNQAALAWLNSKRWLLLAGMLIAFGILVFFGFKHWQTFTRPMTRVGYTVMAYFFGSMLLYSVLFRDSMLAGVLRLSGLRRMGAISYCVYLIHQPILGLCHWLILDEQPFFETPLQLAVTVLALLITLIVAEASWRFFERPLLQLGHRYKY